MTKGNERAVTQGDLRHAPHGVDDGDKVKRGDVGEWDPYTRPIITRNSMEQSITKIWLKGSARSTRLPTKQLGITNRVVMDWRASPRGSDLKPAICQSRIKKGR